MPNEEALQHGEQTSVDAVEWERMKKYTRLFLFFFSFLLPQCVPLLIMLSVQVYGEN